MINAQLKLKAYTDCQKFVPLLCHAESSEESPHAKVTFYRKGFFVVSLLRMTG